MNLENPFVGDYDCVIRHLHNYGSSCYTFNKRHHALRLSRNVKDAKLPWCAAPPLSPVVIILTATYHHDLDRRRMIDFGRTHENKLIMSK